MVAALQKMTCSYLKCVGAEIKYGKNCSGMRRAFVRPCAAMRGFAPFFANTNARAEKYCCKNKMKPHISRPCAIIAMPQGMHPA